MQSLLKLAGNSLGTLQSTMEMAVPQMFPMLPGNLRALPQGMEEGNSILVPSICCISVQWQLYMMQMRHSSGNKASTSVSLTVTIVFVVTEITTDTNFSFSTWYIDIVFIALLPLDGTWNVKSLQFLNSAGQWQEKITFFVEHIQNCSREWEGWVWCCHGNG